MQQSRLPAARTRLHRTRTPPKTFNKNRAARAAIIVFLGAFPPAGTPVQLAVRSPNGRVERFGAIIHNHGGPRRAGFHNPRLSNQEESRRFLDAVLESGALVSNGYNSFWNRVSPARNREVRETTRQCSRQRARAASKGRSGDGREHADFRPLLDSGYSPKNYQVVETH